MCAQTSPIRMDLAGAAAKRHEMVAQGIRQLQHLAYRAKSIHGQKNDEVVVVCIKMDSGWRPIVDALMPGYNWQEIRNLGQEPIARGTAYFSVCQAIAKRLPGIANVLLEKPNDGYYKCIALDEGGCTVHEIQPIEQTD